MRIWMHHLARDLFGPYGYRTWIIVLTTVTTAYFGAYAIIESRHDRQLNRALFERNTFITMVTSENRGTFLAAMENFGPIQTIATPSEPSIFCPLRWFRTEMPNVEPMRRWAQNYFGQCKAEKCGIVDDNGGYRIDLLGANFANAILPKIQLSKSRLMNADLRGANLQGAFLSGSNLLHADLRGADLKNAHLNSAGLDGADLRKAILSGADLTKAIFRTPGRTVELNGFEVPVPMRKPAQLQGADLATVKGLTVDQLKDFYWDEKTILPEGVDRPCDRNLPEFPCLVQ